MISLPATILLITRAIFIKFSEIPITFISLLLSLYSSSLSSIQCFYQHKYHKYAISNGHHSSGHRISTNHCIPHHKSANQNGTEPNIECAVHSARHTNCTILVAVWYRPVADKRIIISINCRRTGMKLV